MKWIFQVYLPKYRNGLANVFIVIYTGKFKRILLRFYFDLNICMYDFLSQKFLPFFKFLSCMDTFIFANFPLYGLKQFKFTVTGNWFYTVLLQP